MLLTIDCLNVEKREDIDSVVAQINSRLAEWPIVDVLVSYDPRQINEQPDVLTCYHEKRRVRVFDISPLSISEGSPMADRKDWRYGIYGQFFFAPLDAGADDAVGIYSTSKSAIVPVNIVIGDSMIVLAGKHWDGRNDSACVVLRCANVPSR